MSSPVVVGEDGTGAPPANMAGFEFGIDPNEDPELALVGFLADRFSLSSLVVMSRPFPHHLTQDRPTHSSDHSRPDCDRVT